MEDFVTEVKKQVRKILKAGHDAFDQAYNYYVKSELCLASLK